MNRRDIENSEDVDLMVNSFYDKVRKDELLAPVFSSRITGHWEPHLQTMRNFWYSVLFAQPVYQGNPFAKHIGLIVDETHFNRWLQLFNANLDEHFAGDKTEEAKTKAGKMSQLFQFKMKMNAEKGFRNIM
ncbi:group III truncated hemoglobin [Foetidibacter luteolus]|uniref:group III truncated hemoglobin n=1 Tax=Foetidibacter luteolus TaxID=2608880 RepID=UPI00129BEAB2|nr:group III truncated hemoglobin [Foetidibacter luteolus]